MATAGVHNLPQMRSIWLDEDQEAEKLYGLQAQQFMAPDDDGNLAIMMVNSDRPLLSNKQNISLGPSRAAVSQKSKTKKKKKRGIFGLFRGKERHAVRRPGLISTPFGFQHISHADVRAGFESEDEHGENTRAEEEEEDELPARPLSRAFVTHSLPADMSANAEERKRISSRMSIQASISTTGSSRYSRLGNSAGRIVSSSTMATSVLSAASSPSRVAILPNMDRLCIKDKQNRVSDGSGTFISFLKDYDFPTLLESASMTDEAEALAKEADNRSSTRLSRVNSEPHMFGTPQMESRWFNEESPISRKSLDDVLLCYHQPSITSSPSKKSPVKSLK